MARQNDPWPWEGTLGAPKPNKRQRMQRRVRVALTRDRAGKILARQPRYKTSPESYTVADALIGRMGTREFGRELDRMKARPRRRR